jgi:hypothetical protein
MSLQRVIRFDILAQQTGIVEPEEMAIARERPIISAATNT